MELRTALSVVKLIIVTGVLLTQLLRLYREGEDEDNDGNDGDGGNSGFLPAQEFMKHQLQQK